MVPAPPDPGSDSSWLRQEEILERFESAWQRHGHAAIDDFLPPPDAAPRRLLLLELIKIDLEYQWARARKLRIEDYLRQFPELSNATDAPLALIAEEIRVRRLHGCPPSAAELVTRFPECAALLGCVGVQGANTLSLHASKTPGEMAAPAESHRPPRLGRYELREQLGRGGFATVYRAWDPELHRNVAIKVPHPGLLDSSAIQARLFREASSAARLRHPGLVPLHEVGHDNEQLFIVSEYIPGRTLAQVLTEVRPTSQQAAAWVLALAEALAYAHRLGIIHRDVKPGNIMLDQGGQPVLTDFGLALQADASVRLTQDGDIIGTPAYMAPEQAAGWAEAADARCDIYSLGVVLYELLCGRPPFTGPGPAVLHQVLHAEPPAPRQLQPNVPLDLETICLQAMAKEPARRYASADELAEDLRRYLGHQPIRARRVGLLERIALWCHRKPALAVTIGLALFLIAVTGSVSLWRVIEERDRARQEEARAVTNLYESLVREARALRLARAAGYRGQVWQRLAQALHLETPAHNLLTLRNEAVACMGDFVGLDPVTWDDITPPFDYLVALAVHPASAAIACGLTDRSVSVRDLTTGQETARLRGHRSGVFAVAYHPDGRQLASFDDQGEIRIWEAVHAGWECRYILTSDASQQPGMVTATSACYTRDGKYLVTCAKGATEAVLWDLATGRAATRFASPSGKPLLRIVLSADGHTLLAACRGREEGLILWELATARLLREVSLEVERVTDLAVSPDGQLLACATANGVFLLDTAEFKQRLFVRGDYLYGIAFSPDSQHLAIPSNHFQLVRLWNLAVNREVATLAHQGEPHSVAFTPDGRRLVSQTARSLRTWQLDGSGDKRVLAQHAAEVTCLAFSPDGSFLVSASGPRVQLWDPGTGKLLHTLPPFAASVVGVALHPDASILVTADDTGVVRLWSVDSPQTIRPLQDLATELGPALGAVQLSPTGEHLAVCGERGTRIWRLERPGTPGAGLALRLVATPSPRRSGGLSFTPDGRYLNWVEYHDSILRLWDLHRGQETVNRRIEIGPQGPVFFSDGRQVILVTATHKGEVQVWDLATGLQQAGFGREQVPYLGFSLGRTLALCPGGTWLAVHGRAVTLWDLPTRELRLVFPQEQSDVLCSAWNPRGTQLAIGTADGGLVLWNLPTMRSELQRLGLDW